ncbi:terpene synthase family protein [Streptomyces sp. NPDC052013]|uniref:terpene synthase family protein n=1 Tax=Streptomyces sp. NPDC052013 TaxID=3365679 RepID=UPI0037D87FCB
MEPRSPDADQLSAATGHGRIAALATEGHRDLLKCAKRYPDLFPQAPFHPTVFSGTALATAFGAPWLTADQLRMANRTALWIFAADWQVDYMAKSREEIAAIRRQCLTTADGAAPPHGSSLSQFLYEIQQDLNATTAFSSLRSVWRAELKRTLDSYVREWEWKAERSSLPTFADYMDNADNIGSSFVNISHWIAHGNSSTLRCLEDLTMASRQVQRVLRLLNDLATYQRDLTWNDLNALMLGVNRTDVHQHIAQLTFNVKSLLEPLKSVCPQEVMYLERQIGFSTGFYGVTDYWGTLR